MAPASMHPSATESTAQRLNMGRKAVIYRRVSGKDQADNFSLRNQDTRCVRYCAREGLAVDKEFTDVGTGLSIKHRGGFVQMCAYVMDQRNGITDVVFNDLDRFSRNFREFFAYTDPLVAAGITLHIAIDGEKYDYNSEEKWQDRILAAQKESKRISRRTKEGQRIATELGYHIGPPPWGYMLAYESEELNEKGQPIRAGYLVPDPELWHWLLKLWEMAEERHTPAQIAKFMRQHNVPPPRDTPWTDGAVRYILRNPRYKGRGFRGVRPQSRIPGPQENAPPVIREDAHQAAVSPEVFEKVNADIDNRRPKEVPPRSHSSPNPLSHRLKCGECAAQGEEANLVVHRQRGVPYVRCSRRRAIGTDVCTFTGARLDTVLEIVASRLTNYFLTEETLETIVDGVAEASMRFLEEQNTHQSGIRGRKKRVKDEIQNINGVLRTAGNKARNLRSLIEDLEGLEAEMRELEKQSEQIAEVSEESRLFVNDKAGIIETILDYKTFTDPADPEAVREFFNLFVDRVEIFAREKGTNIQRGIIHYDLPIRQTGSEDTPSTETIYLEKRRRDSDPPKSCALEGCMGIDPVYRAVAWVVAGFPRTRGDRPRPARCDGSRCWVPPHTRG